MIKVIGVRFRSAGKIYYFSPGELEIKTGDRVIVETARGIEYGKVVLGNREVEEEKVIPPLKQVIRMATPADEEIQKKNREKAKEARMVVTVTISTLKKQTTTEFRKYWAKGAVLDARR